MAHNDDAIGVCKACSRAVCAECTASLSGALACSSKCEKRTQELIKFETWAIAESKRSMGRWEVVAKINRGNARMYLLKSAFWVLATFGCGYVLGIEDAGPAKAGAFLGLVFSIVFTGTCIAEYLRWGRLARTS